MNVKKHLRQLPVIAAIVPSLVLNQIAVVQALDRRQGSVFYLDIKYGQTKGAATADADLINAKTGHASSDAAKTYATPLVRDEAIGALGSTNYTGTLTYYPVITATLTITDGTTTFTDNGSGVMVPDDSAASNGTINITTGVYDVTFSSTTTAAVTADYQYNYEKISTGVPEVNIDMTAETIEAMDFPLRAKYTLGSAIDLEKAHGINLEDEIVKYLGGEINETSLPQLAIAA